MRESFLQRPPESVPQLIFLDLDGTLLNSELALSERNLGAMGRVRSVGVHLVLASGRPFASILRFSSLFRGEQFIVASNGGAVLKVPGNTVLSTSELPVRSVNRVLRIARDAGASPCVYKPTTWYVERIDDWIEIEIGRTGTRPIVVSSLFLLRSPLIKVLLIGDGPTLRSCEGTLAAETQDEVEWFYTYPEYLEIMPKDASKKKACLKIMSHLGVRSSNVLAIGDGYNDRRMLECAEYRMAVSNAAPELLDVANCLTLSNDEDGVAVALEGLILKNRDALRALTWL